MIGHTGVMVGDFEMSKEFYAAALATLGYRILPEFGGSVVGFGEPGKPDSWIGQGEVNAPRVHVPFRSDTRQEVGAFYEVALGADDRRQWCSGAACPLPPQLFYGAFVLHPDGHNIEAVCHTPA